MEVRETLCFLTKRGCSGSNEGRGLMVDEIVSIDVDIGGTFTTPQGKDCLLLFCYGCIDQLGNGRIL
jgi:hypothetical protein